MASTWLDPLVRRDCISQTKQVNNTARTPLEYMAIKNNLPYHRPKCISPWQGWHSTPLLIVNTTLQWVMYSKYHNNIIHRKLSGANSRIQVKDLIRFCTEKEVQGKELLWVSNKVQLELAFHIERSLWQVFTRRMMRTQYRVITK